MKTIVLADINAQYLAELREAAGNNGFLVLDCCNNGVALVESVGKCRPDIVVCELVLPGCDGLEAMMRINNECSETRILCNSFINNSVFIKNAVECGASYYIIKPSSPEVVIKRAVQICQGTFTKCSPAQQPEDIKAVVSELLNSVGMSHARLGFKYCIDAIGCMLNNAGCTSTTEVYKALGKKYSAEPYCIERNIRSAIEDTWTRGDIARTEKLFGYTVHPDKGKPTNKEFLSAMYEFIKIGI